jgi:xanthine/uracil permease
MIYGLQWLAVTVPGIVIIGRVIGEMHAIDQPNQLLYLQKICFIVGVLIVCQVFWGHRLPLVAGPSTVLLIGMIASAGFDTTTVYSTIMAGGAILFLVAVTGLFSRLQALFTVRVVAVVLLLIAFTLMPTVLRLLTSDAAATPLTGLLFGTLLVLSMLAAHRYAPPAWKSTLIVWSMIAGTSAWLFLLPGSVTQQGAGSISVIANLFTDFTVRPSLTPGLLISFLFCFLGLLVNDLGSIESVSGLLNPGDMARRINRGIGITGLANILSGFFGVIGPVNFSLSPGVILSTRCASRFTLVPAGMLLILFSFSPLILSVIGAVPPVVIGSILLYVLTFQVGAGMSMVLQGEKGLTHESGIVVGLPVLVGTLVGFMPPDVIDTFPLLIRPIIGNGFVAGVFMALILEHVVYRFYNSNES